MSTSHRPRKKRVALANSSTNGTTVHDDAINSEIPAFPLAALFWPAKSTNLSPWILLPCILMVVFLFRWATALWGYSGLQKPPMHGDFEAQRHWMELTIHLPVTHWYFHDLQWWGLDYPPLTAYHSWIIGTIGHLIEPKWFALYLSHGLDDPDLKVFMRASVVVSEFLVYVPAVVICVRRLARLQDVNQWESAVALTAVLLQPATILIDHGHFQYNTVMLGFMVATLASMLAGRPLWSCAFFVAALGFKQMALFYAPAVAAYLAGLCLVHRLNIPRFIGVAIITLASFALLVLPLLLGTAYDVSRNVPLPSDITLPPLLANLPFAISEKAFYYPYLLQLCQAVHRIFPFSRGLFEDKVANLWCAIHSSGLHKLHAYSAAHLSRAALLLTLAAITPPCALLFFKPQKGLLLHATAATAWAFFLCSYQVHEKNILLPLLPTTLLLASADGMHPSTRAWVAFANTVACWTMFPLLKRDELRIPYFVLTSLWTWLLGAPPFDLSCYFPARHTDSPHALPPMVKFLHLACYAAMLLWHALDAFLAPPPAMPDLWVVGNVCLGALAASSCYLWCLACLVEKSGLWSALRPRAMKSSPQSTQSERESKKIR
nr:putative dolichyl pyrophosphate man9glcnac2 alpha-1,3-glucosyltransferase [Quercus suber]